MRLMVLCFTLGCASALGLPMMPSPGRQLALMGCCLLALTRPALHGLALFFFGLVWTLFQGQRQLESQWPEELAFASVIGEVTSLPEQSPERVRFLFDIAEVHGPDGGRYPSPGRVRLNWYGRAAGPLPGERWRLNVKLRPAQGFANPGSFDYETWLFSRKIRATGYVRSGVRLFSAIGWRAYLPSLRYALSRRIDQLLGDNPQHGLIRALALGERSAVSRHEWEVLRATGTGHLLAISGLHIGLIAMFGFWLGRGLWSVHPALSGLLPTRYVSALSAIACALIYAALAGFSLPTQRALIMLCLFMSGILTGRRWRMSSILAAALGLILLYHPFSLLTAEFWLSFLAVSVIAWLVCCRCRLGSGSGARWKRSLLLQMLIPIGLLPLLMLWFQEFAVYSGFANMIAIPLLTFTVVPLIFVACLLSGVTGLALPLFELAAWFLGWLFEVLDCFRLLPLATLAHPAPGLSGAILALLGVALLLMPRGVPGRWLGFFLLLPLLFPSRDVPAQGEFRLYLLDVGQGLSALVRTRNHVLVYDTGDAWSENFDAGQRVVVPVLRNMGINRIDMLLLSHGDRDHIGGADSLLQAYPVEQVLGHRPRSGHPRHRPCVKDMEWDWDGVRFRILHPEPGLDMAGNDNSCVLSVTQPGMRVLLPGDIEARAESHLLALGTDELRSQVLVAPHHGSLSSSSPNFIRAVAPQFVLFPAGYRNRFGFPRAPVVERYRALGAHMYSSAGSGTIRVWRESGMIRVREYRETRRRFWLRPPERL